MNGPTDTRDVAGPGEVPVLPRYWTLLEALKQTADPSDWEDVRSQRGLRLIGLGPTAGRDGLLRGQFIENDHAPTSILPGRLAYVPNLGRTGVRQDLEALRRAARPLRRALIAEVYYATGIPFGKNERVPIPSDLWRGFVLDFETSSVEDTGGRRFDGVRISSASVQAQGAQAVQNAGWDRPITQKLIANHDIQAEDVVRPLPLGSPPPKAVRVPKKRQGRTPKKTNAAVAKLKELLLMMTFQEFRSHTETEQAALLGVQSRPTVKRAIENLLQHPEYEDLKAFL